MNFKFWILFFSCIKHIKTFSLWMLISTSCLHVSLQWEGKSKGFREGGLNAVPGVTEMDTTKQTPKLTLECMTC